MSTGIGPALADHEREPASTAAATSTAQEAVTVSNQRRSARWPVLLQSRGGACARGAARRHGERAGRSSSVAQLPCWSVRRRGRARHTHARRWRRDCARVCIRRQRNVPFGTLRYPPGARVAERRVRRHVLSWRAAIASAARRAARGFVLRPARAMPHPGPAARRSELGLDEHPDRLQDGRNARAVGGHESAPGRRRRRGHKSS
jgi:hypothetical protein